MPNEAVPMPIAPELLIARWPLIWISARPVEGAGIQT
jgi:hypothetical protein